MASSHFARQEDPEGTRSPATVSRAMLTKFPDRRETWGASVQMGVFDA